MESKKELRAKMRLLRASLGAEARAAADATIAAQICSHPAYLQANTVFTYLSVGDEVDTRAIIRDAWQRGKRVAIPRVVAGTRTMEWYAIKGFDGMETTAMGVEEPPADPGHLVVPPAEAEAQAIALVPGFSFDAQGFRLGYGGGFYDVFLPTFGGTSLGLCRNAQFSATPLPHDAHDVPVDELVVG